MGCGCGGRRRSTLPTGGVGDGDAEAPAAGPRERWEVTLPSGSGSEVYHVDSDTEAYRLIKQHGGGGVRRIVTND
ncbi:hypothetical protein IL38_24175 [Actinopolyspora erythraea]|uniref:SPOR domain-containing protein n=2 Tax=Actinopolyspora erythraea TaxID=414996 RepID=A0ABR4WYD4_9ACTN|nr:hypothetical protein IL38_24175 [Actinopolyspora erythraea]